MGEVSGAKPEVSFPAPMFFVCFIVLFLLLFLKQEVAAYVCPSQHACGKMGGAGSRITQKRVGQSAQSVQHNRNKRPRCGKTEGKSQPQLSSDLHTPTIVRAKPHLRITHIYKIKLKTQNPSALLVSVWAYHVKLASNTSSLNV